MNGYLIARFDMTDPDKAPAAYKRYVETATPAYAERSARFLVRGGKAQLMEGEMRARNVVIEFPTLADAYGCYQSETYQAAREHRLPVAEGEIVVVEGMVKERPAQKGDKGYWIARYDVQDMTAYKRYVETGASAFKEHEALFLVRGGPHQAMEGQARDRNVVIEFPSVQAALDCYNSDTYQKAREYRLPVSVGDIVIVEGA